MASMYAHGERTTQKQPKDLNPLQWRAAGHSWKEGFCWSGRVVEEVARVLLAVGRPLDFRAPLVGRTGELNDSPRWYNILINVTPASVQESYREQSGTRINMYLSGSQADKCICWLASVVCMVTSNLPKCSIFTKALFCKPDSFDPGVTVIFGYQGY